MTPCERFCIWRKEALENNNWKDDAETRYQNEYRQYDYESEMDPRQYVLLEERNIALAVIFSFLTFGIYYIYWFNKVANTIKIMDRDYSGAAPETIFFFIVPFYSFYWVYTRGRKLAVVANEKWHYHKITDDSFIYIVVAVLLCSFVVIAIMQNDINSFAGDLRSARSKTAA